jgi:hypothetical protein
MKMSFVPVAVAMPVFVIVSMLMVVTMLVIMRVLVAMIMPMNVLVIVRVLMSVFVFMTLVVLVLVIMLMFVAVIVLVIMLMFVFVFFAHDFAIPSTKFIDLRAYITDSSSKRNVPADLKFSSCPSYPIRPVPFKVIASPSASLGSHGIALQRDARASVRREKVVGGINCDLRFN